MSQQAQVIALHQPSVFSMINTFLRRKRQDSIKTAQEYERDIRDFFKFMTGKEIENLFESDLQFTLDDVTNYQLYLKDRYSSSTVNRKLSSVRALYKRFSANGLDVNPDVFNVEAFKTSDSESYGSLTWGEVKEMIERVKSHRNGIIKSLVIELAVVTAFRIESLLSLTWGNFSKKDGVWVVSVIGKGQKLDEKAIRDDLYERLREHCGKEKLFDVTARTMRNTINKLCKEMNIPEERNISFHSLKKSSLHEAYLLSGGDLMTIKQHGCHSSAQTTMDYYLKFKKDYSEMISLQIGQELDMSILNQLSKEELIDVIMSCDRGTQMKILNKVKDGWN